MVDYRMIPLLVLDALRILNENPSQIDLSNAVLLMDGPSVIIYEEGTWHQHPTKGTIEYDSRGVSV